MPDRRVYRSERSGAVYTVTERGRRTLVLPRGGDEAARYAHSGLVFDFIHRFGRPRWLAGRRVLVATVIWRDQE